MINVKITRDELRQHNACANGMALFESIVALQGHKRSIYIRDWTPLHMVWCASAYPGFWQWCRDLNIVPQVTLTRANLTRAYYPYGDLPDTWERDGGGYLRRK